MLRRGGSISDGEEVEMEALEHICARCHAPAVFGFGTTWV
jgi:hypothetical protein